MVNASHARRRQSNLDQIVNDIPATSDREVAVALHDYVRDHVAFGFTPYFDAATPEQTLALGIGHCNPQASLIVALLRRAGLKARFQPVTIDNKVLYGAIQAPPRLSHVFTEVLIGDAWQRLDSYIVDLPLCRAAVSRLKSENRELGYGCHVDATGIWNGIHDSYSQVATPQMILEVHEPVDRIETFYASRAYRHRVGPLRFSSILAPARIATKHLTPLLNAGIERIRCRTR